MSIIFFPKQFLIIWWSAIGIMQVSRYFTVAKEKIFVSIFRYTYRNERIRALHNRNNIKKWKNQFTFSCINRRQQEKIWRYNHAERKLWRWRIYYACKGGDQIEVLRIWLFLLKLQSRQWSHLDEKTCKYQRESD